MKAEGYPSADGDEAVLKDVAAQLSGSRISGLADALAVHDPSSCLSRKMRHPPKRWLKEVYLDPALPEPDYQPLYGIREQVRIIRTGSPLLPSESDQ